MRVGFVGLGRMGGRMAARLLSQGHEVVAYDQFAQATSEIARLGAENVESLGALAGTLEPPRLVWMMVPAGEPVREVVETVGGGLSQGDVLVDGGNSFYKNSVEHARCLDERGVAFLDVGTSGGLEGASRGASLTVGGSPEGVIVAAPVLDSLAREDGWAHVGPSGAGHFVKMVHNGVEYALEQAYGEGFELLRMGPYDVDLAEVASVWNNGSVIRSWLLELAADSFLEDPELARIAGRVGGGETGQWAVESAMEFSVPVPVMALALLARYRSRQSDTFAGKVAAAVRNRFGGHEIVRIEQD
ncbi:MAG: decarboxylating 6-phosphogluconate dehydrogenase [Actinobacteria bacterium]|nr:MAG: decarboxylating 6-phosphogluconate dehydrogenase [Actinomycetota bacterium]